MSENYFFMIADSPWAGPTVKVVDVPDVDATDGEFIGGVSKPFRVDLITDPRVLPTESFPPRDIHEASGFKLFSRKFIDILTGLGVSNIEYLPAEVTDVRTAQKVDYSVANILGRLSALDEDESDFVFSSSGKLMGVNSIVFDEKKIEGHKIFMLGEIPLLIVAHKSIKEAVEEHGLTGFVFLAQDEYEPGMI